MKTFVIAEKPSVALDIAKALGKPQKSGEVYEVGDFLISSAVGHLVELCMPEDIDAKRYGFWRLSELPIIPEKFGIKPVEDKRNRERLNMLIKIMNSKEVGAVWNACDAGREGELIFTYIYQLAKCKKPVSRVWMQSMTKDAIRTAFDRVRSAEEMQGLQDAARSRSEADWLIGINGTRAITKRMFGRGKGVATVGRVQTPTLSIVLERELTIRNFKPRPFWKLTGTFTVAEGSYESALVKDSVDKSDEHDKPDRFWEEAEALRMLQLAQSATWAGVQDTKKRTTQAPARLYDLTTLQREANNRFGLPANKTLQLAQALYEKHKLITYPRTDSQALPEDYIPTVKDTLAKLSGEYAEKARPVLSNGWVKPNKRIFNNAQVSDHFAIIPTGVESVKLSADEAKVYDMIVRKFIAIFYPPAEFDVTTRLSKTGGLNFRCEGKVLVKPGFLDVYGRTQLDKQLPALTAPDQSPAWLTVQPLPTLPKDCTHFAQPSQFLLADEHTKPPSRYTEATLLSAMEGAGKLVEDEELAAAMKEKGLGTPATRASTIEHLLKEKYLERDAKFLVPTTKAESLFEFLSAIKVEDLTSPVLTGEWEHRLLLMEQGKLSREAFMKGIFELTHKIVESAKGFTEKEEEATESSIINPADGKPLLDMLRAWKTQDGTITIYKTIGNRRMQETEVQTLLRDGRLGPLDDFRSKAGKPFSAILKLVDGKVSFDFGNGGQDGNGENSDGTPINLDELQVIGTFKETGEPVYEAPNAFACRRALTGEKDKTFRISRTMLGKTLTVQNISDLLEHGKTAVIQGFRSNRTKRLFDAHLLLKPGGGIGFEFPPRPAAKKAAAKKVAKKSASSGDNS